MPADPAKHRVALWLRAEQALGLESVSAQRVSEPAPQQKAALPSQPGAAPVPAKAATGLFGADEAAGAVTPPAAAGAFSEPPLSRDEKIARLRAMDEGEVTPCRLCRLSESRTHTVFGEGDPEAKIFFIGEGPGETEDRTGRPFVGRAGELLNKMILGMGLRRDQVFIANIVKCRPPSNRVPAPDEVATCTPYLVRQLQIIRPQVIVTLGLPSAQYMLQTRQSMGSLRGRWQLWRGIKLMPTYHPAFLLRSYTEANRAAVWSDLKAVMTEVGLPLNSPRR